jgi:hypothetical protein
MVLALALIWPAKAMAWHDEIHVAIAKATGYEKWFNAAAADIIKVKAGYIEYSNHFVNNPPGSVVDEKMVLRQAKYYNTSGKKGHLYGAIIASVRDFAEEKKKGKYGQYHLAFCAHYVGDLSQPLHNILYSRYNKEFHLKTDGILQNEVMDSPGKIILYPITIKSENDLAREVARIANLSLKKGYQLEKENRLLTREEAYECFSHSASLFKAILNYVDRF